MYQRLISSQEKECLQDLVGLSVPGPAGPRGPETSCPPSALRRTNYRQIKLCGLKFQWLQQNNQSMFNLLHWHFKMIYIDHMHNGSNNNIFISRLAAAKGSNVHSSWLVMPWNQMCTLPPDPCWTSTKMLWASSCPTIKTTQHPYAPAAPSENKSLGEWKEREKMKQDEETDFNMSRERRKGVNGRERRRGKNRKQRGKYCMHG